MRPKVFAYYFPNWHKDPRNASWFGDSWDEWQLVRDALPRFDGHRQPRVPLHGHVDESDPAVAAEQIALARAHGVDGFFVDFYWYEDGAYLNGALDRGLLKAGNRSEVEFALMWANHELVDIFPLQTERGEDPHRLRSGAIGRASFERMAETVVREYFSQPNYYTVDNKPWFSIYEIGNLVAGLGGPAAAADALRWFDELAQAAGFDGIHFDAVVWGIGVLPGSVATSDPEGVVAALGFSSVTSYVWVHHADMARFDFPQGDIGELRDSAFAEYESYVSRFDVPFHPNVTVGWDSSPRLGATMPFSKGHYPAYPVWDSTPAEFAEGLQRAKRFVLDHPTPHPIITINAWNEWSEGSSLLPDVDHGLRFLEQIVAVLGPVDPVRVTAGQAPVRRRPSAARRTDEDRKAS
jgi:hypothetical protein